MLEESNLPIQLPNTRDLLLFPGSDHDGRHDEFSFDASTWNTSTEHTIDLTQILGAREGSCSVKPFREGSPGGD